ncbi:MAG: hypothetical protein PHV20_12205 [Bacteroidales bacterium]|nr:hypothetical protein [Bacteroidales bacterium]
MTELFIEGYPVVLPDGFEIVVTEENTFLTKSGEYTYDVDISLMNSTNAKIYKHINRKNSTDSFDNRKAILIVDNRVLLNGIENILEITNTHVKIQLLSGNAELNFVGTDQFVNKLDLGEVENRNITSMEDCEIYFPDVNWAPTPIKCNGSVPYLFWYTFIHLSNPYYSQQYVRSSEYVVPQPYLLTYVNKVFDAMGYSILENCLLNDERAKRVLVCNEKARSPQGGLILKYEDILPKWTVSGFITEIEKLFNVVCVIDKLRKSIRILKGNSYYENTVNYIKEVIDDYDSKVDKENQVENYAYANIQYGFPETDQYKYMMLAQEIYDAAAHFEYSTFSLLMDECTTNFAIHRDKRELFYVTESDRFYILEVDATVPVGFQLIPVHVFRKYGTEVKQVTELKIIPAPIELYAIPLYSRITSTTLDNAKRYVQVPAIPFDTNGQITGSYDLPQPLPDQVIQSSMVELIENGLPASTEKDRLYISINAGLDFIRDKNGVDESTTPYPIYNINGDVIIHRLYPSCQNDIYYTGFANFEEIHHSPTLKSKIGQLLLMTPYTPAYNALAAEVLALTNIENKLTLSLTGFTGFFNSYYDGAANFNFKKPYIFDFSNGTYNPRGLFVIENREFICEKLEYKVNANGFAPIVKGYFYPKL